MGEMTPVTKAKIALLDLIQQTDEFKQITDDLALWYGPESPIIKKHRLIFAADQLLINQGILQFGGLEVTVESESGQPEQKVLLAQWQGRDPERPGMHSWLGQSAYDVVPITLHPSAIAEMRAKIQANQAA